jgi:pimeloyl-ACP methyl ester carboxylesterase
MLVHGIGVSPRYFHRLAEALRVHGDVYSVELPGFGRNRHPGRQLSVEDLASLLNAFCDHAHLIDPVLVGHSMGTQIVTEMVVQDPALTDRLVLIGTVVDPAAPTPIAQGFRLLVDMLIEPPDANWIVGTDYLRCGPRWYLTELPSMLTYRIEDRLPLLSAAVLVIRGSHDPVSPAAWSNRIAELVPRSVRIDIPKAAHVVQHRRASAVADAILVHSGAASLDYDVDQRRELER